MTGPPGILFRLFSDQRVLFLVVGGVNTVVGTLWFALFDGLMGHRWHGLGHYPALVLAYVFAILCAFVLYRTVVFRVRGNVLGDLLRFSLVYVTAFFINLALLAVLVTGLGWPAFGSQCSIVFVTTLLSWFGHRRFSFRRTTESPAPLVDVTTTQE
jgi:putative flippase GtrA